MGGGMAEPAFPSTPAELTERVLASFNDWRDPRLREIMQSLIRHLHAFVTEVGLTEAEWKAGARILAETGRITDAMREEFVLRSDVVLAPLRPDGSVP